MPGTGVSRPTAPSGEPDQAAAALFASHNPFREIVDATGAVAGLGNALPAFGQTGVNDLPTRGNVRRFDSRAIAR
jgi:hypothetical protein